MNSEVWVLREAIKGDTLLRALSDLLTWSRKTSYYPSWLVSPAQSFTCSYSYGRGPAIRPQTGDKGSSIVDRLWRTIARLMRPWCNEGRRAVGCECEPLRRFTVPSPMAQRS